MAETAHTVVARKAFACEGYRCHNRVQTGEHYARHVAFPGSDHCNGPRPIVARLCSDCQAPVEMPPPMRRRTPAG